MNRSIDWVFGLAWLAVSMTAIFVGGFFALYFSYFAAGQLGLAIEGTIEGTVSSVAFLTLMSLLLAAAVGAAQEWLLRENNLPIAHWFRATLAGGAIGLAMTLVFTALGGDGFNIASVAIWAGTAIMQWFLLRRFSSRSIAWLIGGVIQIPIALIQPDSMAFKPPIVILVYGIVTAILMVWILQDARMQPSGDR